MTPDGAEETQPPPFADEAMDDDPLTEDAILNELASAGDAGTDPVGYDPVDTKHDMTEPPLSMDGGASNPADADVIPLEPEYTSGPAGDGGGDGGDLFQPPDGAPAGAPTSVRGSMASLRGDPPGVASARGSIASLRGDPPGRTSARGSMASLRGDPATAGSVASLRGDPPVSEDARSVRGSVASLRGDSAIPASVRGSTASVRGTAGDKPAAPVNRPPTSRPPMSAASAARQGHPSAR